MFGSMGLTMSPDLLDNGIFNHLRFLLALQATKLRTLEAKRSTQACNS